MKIIDGKSLAAKIRAEARQEVEKNYLKKGKPAPCLACVIVEGDSASEIYVRNKQKACDECGMTSKVVRLKNDVSKNTLKKTITELNADPSISGILLQLPLPAQLDEVEATNWIDPKKDVDCLTYHNLGALFSARGALAPCTATGVMEILKSENIEVAGKKAVVVGRSLLVGKSVANLLEQANATVTVCHSKTRELYKETKTADILVVAIGKSRYITKEYIKKGAVVIDVGINRTESGLTGDVDFENVKELTSHITPVPGGVGPLTVACLMKNTLICHKLQHKGE